jgi:hypothetical protein
MTSQPAGLSYAPRATIPRVEMLTAWGIGVGAALALLFALWAWWADCTKAKPQESRGNLMPDDPTLDREMQLLWDEGHALLAGVPFDKSTAIEVEQKLRDCAARARANNQASGAAQLERTAKQLADKIKGAGAAPLPER